MTGRPPPAPTALTLEHFARPGVALGKGSRRVTSIGLALVAPCLIQLEPSTVFVFIIAFLVILPVADLQNHATYFGVGAQASHSITYQFV